MTFPAVGLERLYLKSPLRQYIHHPCVMRWLKRRTEKHMESPPLRILEIGCGDGRGLALLHKAFPKSYITGIELDAAMAHKAHQKIKENFKIKVQHASITTADIQSEGYDLIVSFGCVHHIPDWEETLMDLAVYLKPEGALFLEEYYAPLIEHPLYKLVGHHPTDRFTHHELKEQLARNGMQILDEKCFFEASGYVFAKKGWCAVDVS